jgi:hypothetical protein
MVQQPLRQPRLSSEILWPKNKQHSQFGSRASIHSLSVVVVGYQSGCRRVPDLPKGTHGYQRLPRALVRRESLA